MSTVQLAEKLQTLSESELNRVEALLELIEIEREEGSVGNLIDRKEKEGNWVSLEKAKELVGISDDDLNG